MPRKRAGRKAIEKLPSWVFWNRFSPERSDNIRSRYLLENNHVSLTVPAGHTLRDAVEKIASGAHVPIPIESLSDKLSAPISPRGAIYYGYVGEVLNEIAENYLNMQWWISENGLNMAVVLPDRVLSPFDALAGRLTVARWKDGRLSKEALWEIAKELDANGFFLKDELQPKQWKAISDHNQKFAKKAIKTFERCVRDPRFVRSVRRRLYIAREKFESAHSSAL